MQLAVGTAVALLYLPFKVDHVTSPKQIDVIFIWALFC